MKFGKQLLYHAILDLLYRLNSVADVILTRESNIANFDLMPSLHDVIHPRTWSAWQKYLGLLETRNVLLKNFVLVLMKFKRKCPIYERFPPSFSSKNNERARIIVQVFSQYETLQFVNICRCSHSFLSTSW